jgi:transcriptional regulator with XRE-family HTH domain
MTVTAGGCAMTEPLHDPLDEAGTPSAPTARRTLADLRKAAGITQTEVGRRLGVHRSQVSRIEAEYPDLKFTQLRDYLRAIGTHIVFSEPDLGDVFATDVIADPERQEATQKRREDPTRIHKDRVQRPPKN